MSERMQFEVTLGTTIDIVQDGKKWVATIHAIKKTAKGASSDEAYRAAKALYLRDAAGKIERGEGL